MIYFTLPNFFFNFKINNFFSSLTIKHKEYFKIPVAFNYCSGNFPYCYWNGGYNTNVGKGPVYEDFIRYSAINNTAIIFNCANIFLNKENDFEDTMTNLILKENENGSNMIEVSDLNLFYFLKNKYPDYNFIFSKEAQLVTNYDTSFVNDLIKSSFFKRISLPESFTLDLDFLKEIKERDKIELSINTVCDFSCEKYFECLKNTHELQYNFCKDNLFKRCALCESYQNRKPLIDLNDIKKYYVPLGINHFRISEVIHDKKDNLLFFLIDYFIKDEYKYVVLKKYCEENYD